MNPARRDIALDAFVSPYGGERPPDWGRVFGRQAPLTVEIGCGLGDFLVRTATAEPQRDFVGLELDWQRVKKTLRKIALARARGAGGANVRVMQLDARVAFARMFLPRSLERVTCLFPCPWPKKAHAKHRLFHADFLRLANSRIADGGAMQIVTDDGRYGDWIREESAQTGFALAVNRIPPRFGTKYERKWTAGGQSEFFEIRLRKERHQPVPVEEDIPLQVHHVPEFDPERFACRDVTGETSVIAKDFLYDPAASRGMLHLVVAEPGLTQHLWLSIARDRRGWRIAKAEGHTALPSPGVALAMRHVGEEARASADGRDGGARA